VTARRQGLLIAALAVAWALSSTGLLALESPYADRRGTVPRTKPTDDEAIARFRELEELQIRSIERRLANDEPVPTSDLNGLADLRIRIETWERLRALRELTRAPKDASCQGAASRSRSSSAGAKETRGEGRSRKRSD